jgi:hypothetical protein
LLLDIVENRFIGIKSRGCYETPGGTILRAAHVDLEGLAMDREARRLRDSLGVRLSEILTTVTGSLLNVKSFKLLLPNLKNTLMVPLSVSFTRVPLPWKVVHLQTVFMIKIFPLWILLVVSIHSILKVSLRFNLSD